MRGEALALVLWASAAQAVERDPDAPRWSVGVPVEVDLVGLAAGVHPELLFRPAAPDGALHLRFAVGVMAGPELALVPFSLGIRGVAAPRRMVRPFAGIGTQLQVFAPYGVPARARLDLYLELGLDVRVAEGWRVGAQFSPEFGMYPGFGLGMAVRAGFQVDLGRSGG
jgi:hypothetical protein